MADIGYISLLLALVITLYGVIAGTWGQRARCPSMVESARRALYAYTALVSISTLALWYLLLTDDFSVVYVAGHSERALPTFYICHSSRYRFFLYSTTHFCR